MFNLGHKKRNVDVGISKRAVTKEELCVMLYNLPKNVVIISKGKPENNKDGPDSKKKELPPFSSLAGGS